MAEPLSISLQPVFHDDVLTIAKIGGGAFLNDRHTLVKELGKVPYDHEGESIPRFHQYLENWKVVMVKAVDDNSGDILGFAAWGFRGLEPNEIPTMEGAPKKGEWNDETQDEVEKATSDGAEDKVEPESKEGNDESLRQLEAITGGNMEQMMEIIMPAGTRCMFVAGLNVDPKYQRRGVGLKLLQWATETADRLGLWIWVHSSEGAVPAYAKAGFKTFSYLGVDLDEFAPAPPPEGGKWGTYQFSWMKYRGKTLTKN